MTMASATSSVITERLSVAFKDSNTLIIECRDIASDIQNGHTKFLALVHELGPFLTDTDVSVREKGVNTLSAVLSFLPKDFLNETELNFITTFYCDRLKDHHSIIPAVLRGILSIVQMDYLPQDSPARLFNVMFQHIHCQSQLQPDRRNVYLIFETLLRNKADDLRAMGPDFIYGVISAIDGERDPRNLMLLFNIFPRFIKEFPLGHLTEEMFEVIACYFPVDFNSSATEQQNITRDDLAQALIPCLCAIPEFAEFCIPLLTDKLDSGLKVAKLDSLQLLRKGASTFRAGLEQYLTELWIVLRTEVMPGADPEVKAAGLETVTELVKALSDNSSARENFVEKIVTDTKSSLCDVQLSLYWPAEKLLEAVAKANKESCVQVLKAVVPLCLGQYSTKTLVSDKVILMETLNNFMTICAHYDFTIGSVPELAWTDIPLLYLNELTLQDMELKIKALHGLIIQKMYLNLTHRVVLYEKLCNEIDAGCGEVKNVYHTCLTTFAKLHPKEILNVINERLHIGVNDADTAVLSCRLEALTAVARISELATEILPKIITVATSNDSEKSLVALRCLRRLVAMKNSDFDIHSFLYKECIVIDRLITSKLKDPNQILTISNICRSIIRKLAIESQQVVVDKYADVLGKEISDNNVSLLEGLLTPLRKKVYVQNLDSVLRNLYDLAINSSNLNARYVSCKLMAVLINKMDDNEYFSQILNRLKEQILDILESEDFNVEIKRATVHLHTWLTKAVITKGSWHSQDYLDYQINILRNCRVGHEAAIAFKTLIDKSEDTLTEENFCNIKILYKQRIFQHVIQQNGTFECKSRQNYLIALTHLLEEVPIELLFMHLTELVPLLIESLALDNGQLILSTLVTLKLLLETKNDIFSEQVQCFVPRFLNLSTYKEMKVRIAALECLLSYSNYPTALILSYKSEVIEKLAVPIDDRKRLVRKIAVKTRSRWFLIGSPGEGK